MSEPRTLRFWAPLPPRCLHPNGRPGNWQQKHRETAAYRQQVYFLALEAMGRERPHFARAWLDLEYVFTTNRHRDDDGLAAWFKNGRDGIVATGLVDSDDLEHLTIRRLSARVGPEAAVWVTVEEVA